MDPKDPAR
ncbi:unnamed protein product, partial [Rotaria sp. Silwood2]